MKLYAWKVCHEIRLLDNSAPVRDYTPGHPPVQFLGTIEVEKAECQHEFGGEECCFPHIIGQGQCKKCIKCNQWISAPKRTVTKEAEYVGNEARSREIDNKGTFEFLGRNFAYWIPAGGKNIKPPTYEVEE